MDKLFIYCLLLISVVSCQFKNSKNFKSSKNSTKPNTGNVIFFHPDGMSLSHWDAIRLVTKGVEGLLEWDKMPNMAVYRGHTKKYLSATSNAGATIHSYGVKVGIYSFGMDNGEPILSASGKNLSIMEEAKKKGMSIALCQSGVLVEPGTSVFVARSKNRKNAEDISRQVVQSGADIIFGGGEKFLLPEGVKGRFGVGLRKDGNNLITWAKKAGYHIVYTKEEMDKTPKNAKSVLGVFAYDDTYNDEVEDFKNNKPHYIDSAPSISEMVAWTLDFLDKKGKPFLLVAEEEGTDNFSNRGQIEAFLTAGSRADEVVGVVNKYIKNRDDTLFITASDSNASGLLVTDGAPKKRWGITLPKKTDKDAYLIGQKSKTDKKKQVPFLTKSVKESDVVMPFGIIWPTSWDLYSGMLVKASGLNSEHIKGIVDNTDIYKLMHLTLFGKELTDQH